MKMDYKKFYWLNKYLFTEVNKNFKKRGYLTVAEFFCIVIWKSNRTKGRVKRQLSKGANLEKAVFKITNSLYKANNNLDRLRILVEEWSFRLPMFTAILTVLYEEEFSVFDFRVREQLHIEDFSGRRNQVERYFYDFLPRVKKAGRGKTLRDKDKY